MDSEDDMHDANDIESLDDDFYSGETEDAPMDYYSDYDDVADDYFEDADDSDRIESRRPEVVYSSTHFSDSFLFFSCECSYHLLLPTESD